MRLKKSPQLPGAGRSRTWHHHGSDTPTSHRAILQHSSLLGGANIFVQSLFASLKPVQTNLIVKSDEVKNRRI